MANDKKTERKVDKPKEVQEKVVEREIMIGEVVGCDKLRVRKAASAKSGVLQTIPRGTKVDVDMNGSSNSFYRVIIDSEEGFCMKRFIEV